MRPIKMKLPLICLLLSLCMVINVYAANPVAGLFTPFGPTLLSDNSAELFLNVDGSVSATGTPTITPGDIIVTIVGINTIGGTTIGSGTVFNEVTAITAVKILTANDVDLGPGGPDDSFGTQNIDLYEYTEGPLTAADSSWFDWATGIIDDHNGNAYSFNPVPNTSNDGKLIGFVFEDPAQNYTRDSIIQTCLNSATDGSLRLVIGLNSANSDFISARAPYDLGRLATIPTVTAVDNSNIALQGSIIAQSWPGLNFNKTITGGNGGFSSSTRISGGWPAFDNLDFTLNLQPCIDLVKEVSPDGVTWFDANSPSCSDAPGTSDPAYYRFTIKNCGVETLTSLVINDTILGISNYPVGSNLPAGGPDIVLTSDQISQLSNPNLCPLNPSNPNIVNGGLRNVARVDAEGAVSKIPVFDEDPACIKCACLDLEKEISIDNGQNWYDADTVADAVIATAPHGALYRFKVSNCGYTDLTNVAITDNTLFNYTYTIPSLPAQSEVILTSGQIPEMNVPTRCATGGTFTNNACAGVTIAGVTLQDCDPAVIICTEAVGGCRMTGGHVAFLNDGSSLTIPYGAETYKVTQTQVKKGAKFQTQEQVTYYTLGGQIGAPRAGCLSAPDPKQPFGNWQHTHHQGSVSWNSTTFNGGFSFHSGTASAPDEAYIKCILCADPGWCTQARCAPFKQIFWEGTGVFHNIDAGTTFPNSCSVKTAGRTKPATIHYYKAHVGDFGEPAGNTNQQKPAELCGWTSSGVNFLDGIFATPPTVLPWPLDEKFGYKGGQVCSSYPGCTKCGECPDWYEIEVHCTEDPNSPIIYKVGNFITHGNHQIHPEVGQQCTP